MTISRAARAQQPPATRSRSCPRAHCRTEEEAPEKNDLRSMAYLLFLVPRDS